MLCKLCNVQKEKAKECKLVKGEMVCAVCCFAVSSGRSDLLGKLKSEHSWQKEDVLVICESCPCRF